jgi:hypothetical protein
MGRGGKLSAEVQSLTTGKDRTAQIVSHLGSPPVLATLYFLILALSGGPATYDAVGVTWGVVICVPSLVLLGATWGRRVSDLDLSRLEERKKFLPITLPFGVAMLVAAVLLGLPVVVQESTAAIVLVGVVGTLLTQFWKVSMHVSGAVAVFWLGLVTFGALAVFFVWVPPLVAWSRLRLRQHDLAQVLVGALVGTVCVAAALYPFVR